jgi:agmatinase
MSTIRLACVGGLFTFVFAFGRLVVALAEQQLPLSNYPTSDITRETNLETEAPTIAYQQVSTFVTPSSTKESWNGLVTFGRAPPARCWGAEKDVLFDIAIVGVLHLSLPCTRLILTIFDPTGAPFDTATGFRPGYVHVELGHWDID